MYALLIGETIKCMYANNYTQTYSTYVLLGRQYREDLHLHKNHNQSLLIIVTDRVHIPPHVGYVMALQLGSAKHSQKLVVLVELSNIVLNWVLKRFIMFVAAWEESK